MAKETRLERTATFVPMAAIRPILRRLLFIVVAATLSSCSSSPTSPSSPTKVYIPGVPITLSRIGQTVQLSATAVVGSQSPQEVTARATWQSSNTAVATVSGGMVTAVGAGMSTITASYQGNTGTLNITVAFGNSVTATIDGVPFNAVEILVRKDDSHSQIFVQGSSALTNPHSILSILLYPRIGTFDLASLDGDYYWVSLSEAGTPSSWGTDGTGGSGTLTLSTLTSTSASGTFSGTLGPAAGTTGTRVVTNGVFNVGF